MKRALVHRAGAFALAFLLAAAPAVTADVLIVDGNGGAAFTTIQAAVTSAVDGDVILVKSFDAYGSFSIANLSLIVMADAGANVTLQGSVTIQNLSADRRVVISGLSVYGQADLGSGLNVANNQGAVRLQDCLFQGADNLTCQFNPFVGAGRPGVRVQGSVDTAFDGCLLVGGNGMGGAYGGPCYIGGTGGDGIYAFESTIVLTNCVLQGGMGGNATFDGLGGDGGPGFHSKDYRVVASGCLFRGGPGGIGYDFFPIEGYGNGGTGLIVDANCSAHLLDNEYEGGAAGMSAFGVPGSPGVGQMLQGPGLFFAGSAHPLVASPAAVREGESLSLSFSGAPGDVAMLMLHVTPNVFVLNNFGGALLLDLPLLLGPLTFGAIPASGTLSASVPIPELGPGIDALPVLLQALVNEAAGLRLGGAAAIVMLDGS
jgi:hypothetical protein